MRLAGPTDKTMLPTNTVVIPYFHLFRQFRKFTIMI